jgi:hypothetical protein
MEKAKKWFRWGTIATLLVSIGLLLRGLTAHNTVLIYLTFLLGCMVSLIIHVFSGCASFKFGPVYTKTERPALYWYNITWLVALILLIVIYRTQVCGYISSAIPRIFSSFHLVLKTTK